MVLHHVAQRPGGIVIAAARADAERLGDRDLHVVDEGGVPQRLVEDVAEAQHHQVLHRLLAEVVVDAKDLVLAEDRADRLVHRAGGGEVVADRLFDHHARRRRHQAVAADAAADRVEEVGADGEIEGADLVAALRKERGQLVPARLAGRIDGDMRQQAEEAGDDRIVAVGRGQELLERLAHGRAVGVVRNLAARDRDDAAAVGDLAVLQAVVERRQQLATGKIAGPAEDDVVEGWNGNDAIGHGGAPGILRDAAVPRSLLQCNMAIRWAALHARMR